MKLRVSIFDTPIRTLQSILPLADFYIDSSKLSE